MKVILPGPMALRRGGEVEVGNVYQNPHGRAFFKVVVGIVEKVRNRPWNDIVLIHVNAKGEVVGSSNAPLQYIKNHHDLVGRVNKMPELKMRWARPRGEDK